MTEIITEDFPELTRVYDLKQGVLNEFGNLAAAKDLFAQTMRKHGYRKASRTWIKDGVAAVMQP
jgi:hypothetical protein